MIYIKKENKGETPLFPLENEDDGGMQAYVNGITKPIFEKVLQEGLSNSMTTTPKSFKILWRPNNYRRCMIVKKRSEALSLEGDPTTLILLMENVVCRRRLKNKTSPQERHPTTLDFPVESWNVNPHTKLLSVKGYEGITIQYGREKLSGIYSQKIIRGNKETFLIEARTVDELEERILHHKDKIKKKIDKALFSFAKRFKLSLPDMQPSWVRYEDWVKGEDFIDSLPPDLVVHDTYFKKVYPEGLEFKSSEKGDEPAVHMKNFIKNRALEDVSPLIVSELAAVREMVKGGIALNVSSCKVLNTFVDEFLPVHRVHADNIKTHTKVLKGIDVSFRKFNRLLRERQAKLGDYLGR